jgi:hypothetical protein
MMPIYETDGVSIEASFIEDEVHSTPAHKPMFSSGGDMPISFSPAGLICFDDGKRKHKRPPPPLSTSLLIDTDILECGIEADEVKTKKEIDSLTIGNFWTCVHQKRILIFCFLFVSFGFLIVFPMKIRGGQVK